MVEKVMRWAFAFLLMFCQAAVLQAQQMAVENYARLKRPLWNREAVTVDKQKALLDVYTPEKGFSFTANGKDAVEVEEGDGLITLKLPNKTRYVTIKHDTYGQYTWRVPVKFLKKKRHYRATLIATDPTKAYKLQQQWVVMNISPDNAIVQMDSVYQLLRQGTVAFSLPLGTHTYKVESPFYQAVCDSFILTDTTKVEMNIRLQPVYSYVTVKTPWPYGDIYVDGLNIGREEGTSGRLMEGNHRLSVFMAGSCCYDGPFQIGKAEKKIITLTKKDFKLQAVRNQYVEPIIPASDSASAQAAPLLKATVTLKADSMDTEIWVDREMVGKGQWIGKLDEGYHQVTTKSVDIESEPYSLWITDDFPLTVNLSVPKTSMGLVNVHGNVVGASIFVDGALKGATPTVLTGLSPKRRYTILVSKEGYKSVKKHVWPRGNELVDVPVKMKKKK